MRLVGYFLSRLQQPRLRCVAEPAIHAAQGRVVSTPITTPDILPTLLGLADVAIPKSVEGEDLSRLIRRGREAANHAALYMGVAPFGPREFSREYRAIRTSGYTYVRGLDGPWLLFDDDKDPYQLENLAAKPEGRALQAKLDARLHAALKRIGDDFRPGRSYIEQWGYDVAPYGSVPYGPNAKPQSPTRKPAAK